MESPDSIDARNYENTLALIGRVAPAMQADAQSRAAWSIVTAKLGLKAALAAEGYSLHDGRVATPAAKPTPLTASQIAELAALKAGICALGGPPAPATAAEEVERCNAAAIATMEKTPGLSYFQAVQENSRGAK